jgi:glycosyltransferase involved in cell wall biosynthesis
MHIGLFDTKWSGHHTPYVSLLIESFTNKGHQVTFVTDERHEYLNELPETEQLSVITRSFPGDTRTPSTLVQSVRDQYFKTRRLRTAVRIANRRQIDVFHLLYFNRTQIPFRLATLPEWADIPVVATLHRGGGPFVTTANDAFPERVISYATVRALDSSLTSGALDILTVHSDEVRSRVVNALSSRTTSAVRTVPAPTPEPNVTSDATGVRNDLDLPTETDVILFFGGLRAEKGPDVLVRLLKQLNRPLTVVFAGPPVDFSEADVDTWKSEIEPPVNVVDRIEYIPEEEVDYYFAAADATILPYRRSYGISGPLRRSAMVGTPVIGTAGTDVGRLIDRHDLGATFDVDDTPTFVQALEHTLNAGAEFRPALSTFASSRHCEQTAETLIDIYEEVSREQPG